MKKIIFFGILIIALFLTAGLGCTKSKEDIKDADSQKYPRLDENPVTPVTAEEFEEGRILVDRVRYVQAGSPPFDSTNVIFHNKKDSGYRAEINSDKEIQVQVMTDKDCLLKAQGDKYTIIKEDEGKNVVVVSEKNQGDNRNLCIDATAAGNGQVEVKFKVVELV